LKERIKMLAALVIGTSVLTALFNIGLIIIGGSRN
jgi:hypothetical protein